MSKTKTDNLSETENMGEQTGSDNSSSNEEKLCQKMGVAKFLTYYPQDIYIEALLKHSYSNSFFTKDEWFMRIDELKNMPIHN